MRRVALCFIGALAYSQQVADTSYNPPVDKPAYAAGKGPLVLVDEAHFNFHTIAGRYGAFARLLTRDGYNVKANTAVFAAASLKDARILVIANALHESNKDQWTPPNPSAFSADEIAAVIRWVKQGGSLFLIADHMPFAGAAATLGSALGITFTNGYVRAPNKQGSGPDLFTRASGALADHTITKGIDSLATFTGSAFRGSGKLEPIITLGPGFASLASDNSGGVTKVDDVDGWLQGAVFRLGKGRVAVFGEAAMFSAQVAGPKRAPMGMNHERASNNWRFLLNLIHWLS
jgi:hypothetical protein